MTDSSPGSAGLLVPRWYPSFLGLSGSQPCLPGTSPSTAPAASCFLSMSYRIRFSGLERLLPSPMFVLALTPSSSHLQFIGGWTTQLFCVCMAPSCFDLLSSACLNEGIGWMMEVDQLPIYLLFLWISVYGVYVGTTSYMWWCTGVRGQPFEREFSPSTVFLEGGPLWVIGSLCDILYPADVWTSGWFSCLLPISPLEYRDYRCTPVGSRVWTQVSRLV